MNGAIDHVPSYYLSRGIFLITQRMSYFLCMVSVSVVLGPHLFSSYKKGVVWGRDYISQRRHHMSESIDHMPLYYLPRGVVLFLPNCTMLVMLPLGISHCVLCLNHLSTWTCVMMWVWNLSPDWFMTYAIVRSRDYWCQREYNCTATERVGSWTGKAERVGRSCSNFRRKISKRRWWTEED